MTGASISGIKTASDGALLRLRGLARRGAALISRRCRVVLRAVASLWGRSLQFRVAVTTTVLTLAISLVTGLFLVDKISSGVLTAKRAAAIGQAHGGLDAARNQFAGVTAGDLPGIRQAVDQLTTVLAASGSNVGLFRIKVRSPVKVVDSELAPAPDVPAALRSQVQRGNLAYQYDPIAGGSQSAGDLPGLVVGQPLVTAAGTFELYYLFPLTAEVGTINLVQRTVLLAGIALVLLVPLVAAMVTRQVVRPVRVAAQTAARLAAGDLAQRIPVRGKDDIARLGESFNDMAVSLQQQFRQLQELSRVQQRFTSDVSHELRTPLTTVRMATELLYAARHSFAPELTRSAELLSRELDRFEQMLSDLLEISRYDAGATHLDIETVDLVGIAERAVSASRVLAERHKVSLSVLPVQGPLMVDADARRVERILRNLIANALDHAEGKPVLIQLAGDAHAVAVSVRDRGIGLRPGEAGLVFNRFWRGDPSRSRLTGGTGLGLAISLEDARLHSGWLQAWGERGAGANFRLTLPRETGEVLRGSPLPLDPTALDRTVLEAPMVLEATALGAPMVLETKDLEAPMVLEATVLDPTVLDPTVLDPTVLEPSTPAASPDLTHERPQNRVRTETPQ